MINRFKDTNAIRISIAGSYVDVENIFDDSWKLVSIQKEKNNSLSVYVNKKKVIYQQ